MTEKDELVAILKKLSPAQTLCALAAVAHIGGDTTDVTFPKAVIKKAIRMCRATLGNPKASADQREFAERAITYIWEHVKPE